MKMKSTNYNIFCSMNLKAYFTINFVINRTTNFIFIGAYTCDILTAFHVEKNICTGVE